MTSTKPFDHIIVGGGLQGCLVAHAIAHHQPQADVLLIERSSTLCGNHTWSLHQSDVPQSAHDWFDPLITFRWPGYVVKFPSEVQRVKIGYATITSESLREATEKLAAGRTPQSGGSLSVHCGAACQILSPTLVQLGTEQIDAAVVIDCRGRAASQRPPQGSGYQSFIGHEYETGGVWPEAEPTVMDVFADQSSGFEFLYELPFGNGRVLLEYTRFSEEAGVDPSRAEAAIRARLAAAGLGGRTPVRTETGCLPMPYTVASGSEPVAVAGGYATCWFHAATGYSMPLALRFAELTAVASPGRVRQAVAQAVSRESARRSFTRFLNRMLFCLVKPSDRWKIFRRFYRVLSEDQIARFYAHRFTAWDALRIVVGIPPAGLSPVRFASSFFPVRVRS
jgi:lycopene beta-cyclase